VLKEMINGHEKPATSRIVNDGLDRPMKCISPSPNFLVYTVNSFSHVSFSFMNVPHFTQSDQRILFSIHRVGACSTQKESAPLYKEGGKGSF
jgi:hypothetical protein